MNTAEDSSLDEVRICTACVKESYLRAEITKMGVEAECSFCDRCAKTFSIEQLADRIDKAFEEHYERTPEQADGYEYAVEGSDWERKGEEAIWVIADAAGIEEKAAQSIREILGERYASVEADHMGEEREFAKASQYIEKNLGSEEYDRKWTEFEHGLKTQARYFSRSASTILEEIFSDLTSHSTHEGNPVVIEVGPTSALKDVYRARVFAAEYEKLEDALKRPWLHLGPPPMSAAIAGRMNARGISVFYGASSAETALSEVRPPVGSQVAIAKFEIIRPLRLLDVEALRKIRAKGSIFDPDYIHRIQLAKFMENLSHRITRPVMPHEEAVEYLATQAVADYLATEAKVDGLIFPSVQKGSGALNVVLFHHASRVENVELPPGAELDAMTDTSDEDGPRPEYRVWVTVPKKTEEAKPSLDDPFGMFTDSNSFEAYDSRSPTLRIDLKNIAVHHVKAVSFKAEVFEVERHQFQKNENSPF